MHNHQTRTLSKKLIFQNIFIIFFSKIPVGQLYFCFFFKNASYSLGREWKGIILIYTSVYQYIYIYIYIYKWPTIVWSDLKAPFSIATTLCKGGCYSFPWIIPLNLDPYLIMISVKQGGIKHNFLLVFGKT